MGLLVLTFAVTTLGEVAGLMWWITESERGAPLLAYLGLVAGEAVELAMFIYFLAQAPSKGGGRRLHLVVLVMILIAGFEVCVWAIWRFAMGQFGLAAAAIPLFVLMHLKHDADVANIATTPIFRSLFTFKGFAATGLETLGASLAVHFARGDQLWLAAGALCACITVEHLFGGAIVREALAGRDFLTPHPRRFVGRQNAMTVISKVDPRRVDALVNRLRQIGDNVKESPEFPLTAMERVHFCCWAVAHAGNQPILIWEANFDGPESDFLDELLRALQPGLREIYAHCQGVSPAPSNEELRRHLALHRVHANTFYVGLHGFDVTRIRNEELLRLEIERFLDEQLSAGSIDGGAFPRQVRAAIQSHIERVGSFEWAKQPSKVPWQLVWGPRLVRLMRYVALLFAVLMAVSAIVAACAILLAMSVPLWAAAATVAGMAMLAAAAVYWLRLRWHEKHDPEPDWNHLEWPVDEVFARENQQPINHLANVAPLKHGLVRAITIRAVLFVVHWAARLIYNRGVLAGTSTIHFARWAVINQGRDLLFLSNYDGSWERYLTDFVDRSSTGLTAIWSNTIGFPRTRRLIYGGAADEEKFKASARWRQVPSLLWYSAYPKLTVRNIENNAAIRAGLFAELNDDDIAAWLRRL